MLDYSVSDENSTFDSTPHKLIIAEKPSVLTQGQTFSGVTATKQEHWTTPPRPFTDATLLSAMERAGNDDYDDEVTEKKGLGTTATRAGIIEELVKNE